jgi:RNA polymerase sigma factor (sigma-70 family)
VSRRGHGRSIHSGVVTNSLDGTPAKVGDAKKALIERLFAAHHGALQAFFSKRLRRQADTSDLAQEVYARMLRVENPEAIRDMNAYLFTVAGNLAREHAARDRRRGTSVDIEDATVMEELSESPAYDSEIDVARELSRLRDVLKHLPPRWHAAIVLQYVHGLSQQDIAERLGVSPRMVKKYVGQALGRCRRRMVRLG